MINANIRPMQVPGLRADYASWVRSKIYGEVWPQLVKMAGVYGLKGGYLDNFEKMREDIQRDLKHGETLEAAALRNERNAATMGELFWVSTDMMRLASHAAAEMPKWGLLASDLPARSGLLICETPMRMRKYGTSGLIPEVGLLWSVEDVSNESTLTGLAIAGLRREYEMGHVDDDVRESLSQVLHLSLISDVGKIVNADGGVVDGTRGNGGSRLSHEDESVVPLGAVFNAGPLFDDGTPRPVPLLAAILALIDSPGVATVTDWEPDKRERAQMRRHRIRKTHAVRVIDLINKPRGASKSGTDREYHHRWMVRGHWRNQWYPKQLRNKPRWIQPYLKGPDGAPLLTGEKVQAIR